MRIVKEADIRKNEILDAAAVLFMENGFDDTSVADIMNVVGIAKGTLYHHFKSKEEIMDALIERQTAIILSAARKVAEDETIPVIDRMVQTILALHIDSSGQTEGKEMIEHLHKPQNALMQQKTKKIILLHIPPILTGIIKDGIEQGLFETRYPLECMEMALCYMDLMMDDDIFQLTAEQLPEKIRAFIYYMERMLGVEPGGLAALEQAFGASLGEEERKKS